MKYCYSLILILMASLQVWSQNIKFGHYNDNNGLSHNSVRYISQDKNGFLWFGTFSGLNRFDGYQFKQYLSSTSDQETLLNDDITALEIHEQSNSMWIGTRGGLTLFKTDTHTFQTFLPDDKRLDALPDKEIRSVYIDKFERVWVGTKNKGLSILNTEKNSFENIEIEGFNYVKEIFEDKRGNIWVGSYGSGGVARINLNTNGTIQEINTYELKIPGSIEINPYINFIHEDDKGHIFIGTREGLYKLNNEDNTFYSLPISTNELGNTLGSYFLAIARAPDGKYWLGTLDGVVVCNALEDLTRGKFDLYQSVLSDGTSLVDNLVSALYFDKSGVLWIGTEDGLDKYDPFENQFAIHKDISTLIGNKAPRIRGFSKTFDGKILVVTRNNGLFISNETGYETVLDNGSDIASIYTVDGKIFYCGLWNGKVQIYDYIRNSAKTIETGFMASPVLSFVKLTENLVLIGSFGEGATIFNIEEQKAASKDERYLDGFQINSMVKDDLGLIWLATETGILRLEIDSRKHRIYDALSDEKMNLPDANNVSDILKDTTGVIWASSRYGLSYYDTKIDSFQTYMKQKELSGRWVTDILKDKKENLWLNMNNNSIAKLNTNTNEVNIYQVKSGNRLDVFSSDGFYTPNGTTIYLGAKNGIIQFSIETLEKELASTTPVITSFRIQNKEISPGMEVNGQIPLKKDINLTKKVELNYENRNFSLQFSEPTFANEKLNRFEYMLEGFDTQWIATNGFSRTVQYTNLFPDDYVFKVRSRNGDGKWSDAASYDIKIMSPFWMTPKAIILFIGILGLVTFFVRKELRNRIKLKQELLTEKVNREHDVKLNNEKLRFFTNISHELRTPLTLILGPIKQLLDESEQHVSDYQKSRFELIHNNANRLFSLVNQVLDFRKAQSGELKLKTTETDILAYSKNIFDSYKELAHNKNIELSFITENESIRGWIDNDKYDKILYNLLSNALKFTPDFGNVDLYLRYCEELGNLTLEISDNGIGISEKSQKKIFNRFYQATSTKQNNTGSGIGLSLVQSLVELHKGTIEVKSTPNMGSVFTVKLPIERHFFKENEMFEFVLPKRITHNLKEIPKKVIQDTGIKHKILVIDDNVELRKYLVDYLSGFYKVYEAEHGEQALHICKQIKPTLCVSDVMMPVMNGLEFCEKLKNDQFISHIPVVLLTALSNNTDKVKGYGTGADGYLVKPFDPSLLKLMIENIIKTRLDLKAKYAKETESEVSLLTHSPIDKLLMQKITELINRNLDKSDLSTAFLCQELGMSSSKLYQKIKELTDLAPTEFIRTFRLKKSASLLKSKKYNVSEVTSLIGFNDPLYFSRCFKKQFGYPPSKLIK